MVHLRNVGIDSSYPYMSAANFNVPRSEKKQNTKSPDAVQRQSTGTTAAFSSALHPTSRPQQPPDSYLAPTARAEQDRFNPMHSPHSLSGKETVLRSPVVCLGRPRSRETDYRQRKSGQCHGESGCCAAASAPTLWRSPSLGRRPVHQPTRQ